MAVLSGAVEEGVFSHHDKDDSGVPRRFSLQACAAGPGEGTFLRRKSWALGDSRPDKWITEDGAETSGPFSFVVNMYVDLAPQGLLMLPACMKSTGLATAFLVTGLFSLVSVLTMQLLVIAAELTGRRTVAGVWERVSPGRSWIPVLVQFLGISFSNVSILMLCTDMLVKVWPLVPHGNMLAFLSVRTRCLLLLVTLVAPFCKLRQFASLSILSGFACFATICVVGVMGMRMADGTYGDGGNFHVEGMGSPNIFAEPFRVGPDTILLVNLLSLGFNSHYNGLKYYRELRFHTPSRMMKYGGLTMFLTACTYLVVMIIGFKTFGLATKIVILDSYAVDDVPANVARLCLITAILFGFPLQHTCVREAAIELLKMGGPEHTVEFYDTICVQDIISYGALFAMTTTAWYCTDLNAVMNVTGALSDAVNIYGLPCFMYAEAVRQILGVEGNVCKIAAAWFILVVGCILGALGLYAGSKL